MFTTYHRKGRTDEFLSGLLLLAAIAWSASALEVAPSQLQPSTASAFVAQAADPA